MKTVFLPGFTNGEQTLIPTSNKSPEVFRKDLLAFELPAIRSTLSPIMLPATLWVSWLMRDA